MNTPTIAAALAQAFPGPLDRHATESEAEKGVELILRAYILNSPRKYLYGTVPNLCTTLASLYESLAESERCADYIAAAGEFRRLENVLDLAYEPREDR